MRLQVGRRAEVREPGGVLKEEVGEAEAEGGGNVAGDVGGERSGVEEDFWAGRGRFALRDADDLVVLGDDLGLHRWLGIYGRLGNQVSFFF